MKIKTAPLYFLITTNADFNEAGQISWFCTSTYPTEHDAICALLAMDDSLYTHAKIVKVDLPAAAVPDDLETIIGKTTHE